ncbi:DNA adenine methylase [Hymenobacter cellulosivorans]|uniref:DNA adenine methylase n=1 Tax=Hymenobacter cellulosivorans TaxID=2932249 RepID=A0ABY4F8S7_9BACT|nr:DNA adenine methylase [Hymenobacter cellulosivorans]UOQ53080.1 DNA adenine methylase [Hymenobacter cellulosivorans]
MKSLLGYYGGKAGPVGAWITSQLPPHDIYVEPFGGMCGILMQKRPSRVEVYNDLSGDLVNLFRVVREQPEALREALALTPYARKEHAAAVRNWQPERVDHIERARRTYTHLAQSRDGALVSKSFSFGGAAYKGSVADTFVNGQCRIPEVCGRLRTVLLECCDWQSICRQHDGPDTLFYLDPPYVRSTRTANDGYAHEMTDAQHQELIGWCLRATGSILLSGYDSDLYEPLLAAGWHRRRMKVASHASAARQRKSGNAGRTECLWLNARAAAATPTLFCPTA